MEICITTAVQCKKYDKFRFRRYCILMCRRPKLTDHSPCGRLCIIVLIFPEDLAYSDGAAYVMSCHVAVPSSTTLATMRCQSPLSSEALMSCVGLTLSFNESHRLSTAYVQ